MPEQKDWTWTFVLKDAGTKNAGWWLKLSSPEELVRYYEETAPVRYGRAFENYVYGKDFDRYKNSPSMSTGENPWPEEAGLTDACVRYAAGEGLTILQGISGFSRQVALQQLHKIEDYGAIFINRRGGYHADYDGHHEYPEFVHRKQLVWPDFETYDIRIKQFPGGEHFYAYIDDTQVRDGDTLKWDSYTEAYNHALLYTGKCMDLPSRQETEEEHDR